LILEEPTAPQEQNSFIKNGGYSTWKIGFAEWLFRQK